MILLVSVQLTKAQRRFTEVFDVDEEVKCVADVMITVAAHRTLIRELCCAECSMDIGARPV